LSGSVLEPIDTGVGKVTKAEAADRLLAPRKGFSKTMPKRQRQEVLPAERVWKVNQRRNTKVGIGIVKAEAVTFREQSPGNVETNLIFWNYKPLARPGQGVQIETRLGVVGAVVFDCQLLIRCLRFMSSARVRLEARAKCAPRVGTQIIVLRAQYKRVTGIVTIMLQKRP
jgi:hypothetical protein